MGQSKRLRLPDLRAIFRLIGECRELGVDSTLWRRHMLVELVRLTDAQVAMSGPAGFDQGQLRADSVPAIDIGWAGDRERGIFLQYLRDQFQREDPALQAFGMQVSRLGAPLDQITRSRSQLVDDRTWYRSAAYGDYHCPSGTDDGLMSCVCLANGELHGIAVHRPPGKRPFSPRERRLLFVFHTELAPHLMGDLAPPGQDPISQLSPRLRQVLSCLLEGDSEQQVALRLGLTPATTHQYVKAIYRRLRVGTRGELMARFVRFPMAALAPG